MVNWIKTDKKEKNCIVLVKPTNKFFLSSFAMISTLFYFCYQCKQRYASKLNKNTLCSFNWSFLLNLFHYSGCPTLWNNHPIFIFCWELPVVSHIKIWWPLKILSQRYSRRLDLEKMWFFYEKYGKFSSEIDKCLLQLFFSFRVR